MRFAETLLNEFSSTIQWLETTFKQLLHPLDSTAHRYAPPSEQALSDEALDVIFAGRHPHEMDQSLFVSVPTQIKPDTEGTMIANRPSETEANELSSNTNEPLAIDEPTESEVADSFEETSDAELIEAMNRVLESETLPQESSETQLEKAVVNNGSVRMEESPFASSNPFDNASIQPLSIAKGANPENFRCVEDKYFDLAQDNQRVSQRINQLADDYFANI